MTAIKPKLKDGKTIIDERCYCEHRKSEHNDRYAPGHGSCKECTCTQFTWKEFITLEVAK